MSERSLPWGDTSPGDAGPYTDVQWAEMLKYAVGVNGESDFGPLAGVLDELACAETSPASKAVMLKAGAALVQGRFYVNDASMTLTIADNTSGYARIDLVVLRADYALQTVRAKVVQGTPAASPSAPSPTQIANTTWEIPICQVAVANGFPTITNSDLTDRRLFGANQSLPAGTLLAFAGSAAPVGFMLCAGQAVSRAIYARLFGVIGTTYGSGDGSTTFNLPDLRGRVTVGKDNMNGSSANRITDAAADTLGGTGGAETHTLLTTQIPSHTHTVPSRYGGTDGTHVSALASNQAATQNNISTGNGTGGGQAHANVQPYMALNYVIKF